MSDLPEGWTEAELNELIDEIVGGGTPSKSDPGNFEGSVPFMTVKDMNTPRPATTMDHISEHAVATSSTNVVPEDTLVIATRIGLGKVVRPMMPVAINQDLKAIFHNDAVQRDFLERWFQRHARTIQSLGKGTTVKGITLPVLRSLPVSLPPYEEQKRIAAKIDSLTTKSARARTELTKIEALVERYKAAVIDTEIGRAEKAAQSEHSIEEIATSTFDGPFGSNLKSADYVEAGKRVIRLENIGHLAFIGSKETFISKEKFLSLDRHHLKADDILFSSFISDNIRVCRLPADLDGQALNKADCFAIRLNREIALPGYIMFALGSTKAYDALSGSVHGATRPRINLKQLKSYALLLPPIATQNAAIARIEAALGHIDQVVQEIRGSATALDRIARIKAARDNAQKKPRQRRQGGKTKVTPTQKLNEALVSWPSAGLTFEEIRKDLPSTYEAQKDAIFKLLSSDPPKLRQEFDENDQIMKLKKV